VKKSSHKSFRWAFVGSVYPVSWEARFGVGSSPTIDTQRSLLDSLARFGWKPERIFTTPPIPRFPKARPVRFPRTIEGCLPSLPEVLLIPVGWTNVEPLKTLSIAWQTHQLLSEWVESVREDGDEPRLFVYNLGSTHEQGGFLAETCRDLELPVISLLTDLDYAIGSKWSPKVYRFRRQCKLLHTLSGCIALNPNVLQDFGKDQPALQLEGIVPDQDFFEQLLKIPLPETKENGPPVLLYAGSLNAARGIDLLLEAFQLLPEGMACLSITGDGPLRKEVETSAKSNDHIFYSGKLKTMEERVATFEKADILVNPHRIGVPEARYLFPSKLAEYFASGRYVVSAELPGMENFPKSMCQGYTDDTPEGLATALQKALEVSASDRLAAGEGARSWAKKHLGWNYLGEKIYRFLKNSES